MKEIGMKAHVYGAWNGYHGSYSDSYFVVIESYAESNNSSSSNNSSIQISVQFIKPLFILVMGFNYIIMKKIMLY